MKRKILMENLKTGEKITKKEYEKRYFTGEFKSDEDREKFLKFVLYPEWVEVEPYTEDEIEEARKKYQEELENGKTDLKGFAPWFALHYIEED